MENAYGIGVKNRYDIFYDEDVDPLEIIRQQQEEKEKRKTDKTQSKDKTKNTKSSKPVPTSGAPKKPKEVTNVTSAKPIETTEVANKTRPRPFTDRTAKPSRNNEESKDFEERKNFRNRDDQQQNSANRDRDNDGRRGRGGFRGRGRGRGRGNFFNYENRPPRREFDRHSGSDRAGVRPTEKREGAGSNYDDLKSGINSGRKKEAESSWADDDTTTTDKAADPAWMDTTQDTRKSMESIFKKFGIKEIDDSKSADENLDSKENLPVSEENAEENVKEMTLDEWKREQESKRTVPKYNLRKPGEGEDGNQWKKLYVLKKKAKEDDDDEEEDDEDVDDEEFARRGRHRQLVDIQINFNDSRRGRGRGRGTRGVGPPSMANREAHREDRRPMPPPTNPGRSYRGSMRLNKSGQQSAPRVDDWNDFPSLVTA